MSLRWHLANLLTNGRLARQKRELRRQQKANLKKKKKLAGGRRHRRR
jgi:hypothetical protein